MASEEGESSIENQLWFKDAKATKMACPELDVLGPPVIVEAHVDQFLRAMSARAEQIPECEGTVLYVKVAESIVKVTIERLTEERHAHLSEADLQRSFEALAAMQESLKKHLENPPKE